MSQAEVERFVADVKNNETLMQELTEGVIGLDELVTRAAEKGYHFSADEAKSFAMSQADGQLSEEQLEMAAGGQSLQEGVPVVVVVTDITTIVVALIIAVVAEQPK